MHAARVRQNIDEELQRLREEIAAAKKANSARPDTHDYSEAETRDYFIDMLLKEAGWSLAGPQDVEYEVRGMPTKDGRGYVDYVLWGDDGKPLGIVEAKRTRKDCRIGQQQAKLYADCLEAQFGQRPVIFCSNGYEHWLWDDARYPQRPVQGFYKKDELELLLQRRATRRSLAEASIDERIVERYYQTRAIRKIGEAFERDNALTSSDLGELERMLVESGGTEEDIQRATEASHGLGLFVRSLVGLDRAAAKEAFAGFLTGRTLGANQIEFVNLIVDHLTERGAMEARLLYESPYTDFSPRGVDGLFAPGDVTELFPSWRRFGSGRRRRGA
jgi:type I site-specific restriction endonuclease